ncbi:MAG TPA: hypothetical protein PKC09_01045 [Paracoccus sp. (in: a-proteobacteria)]|uniref:hypothetical protein n=1 Tax=uncultured Paracoccus sp. TaxID=189685 RepID=UPI00261D0E5F|nr:hypothetical protein [uncultured Paracoccus sp.]HMQ39832.1 hypothetical protein [Paracoccus sp. (in: a-proteobacteria)]HMR35767.1 hypothetical protein [Paracoccus sp. (in: a-proteobacteria)]
MTALLRAFLIVVLLLTSQGLAAARGQSRVAGEMVFCAGGELVTLLVDDRGEPVEHVMVCPDMALNLMSAIAVVTPQPVLTESLLFLSAEAHESAPAGRDAPMAQARDPPRSRAA